MEWKKLKLKDIPFKGAKIHHKYCIPDQNTFDQVRAELQIKGWKWQSGELPLKYPLQNVNYPICLLLVNEITWHSNCLYCKSKGKENCNRLGFSDETCYTISLEDNNMTLPNNLFEDWRYFECKTEGSNKFWNIRKVETIKFETRWGKIGTLGTIKAKIFTNNYHRNMAYNKLIQSKLVKGYIEINKEVKTKPLLFLVKTEEEKTVLNQPKETMKQSVDKLFDNDIDDRLDGIFD